MAKFLTVTPVDTLGVTAVLIDNKGFNSRVTGVTPIWLKSLRVGQELSFRTTDPRFPTTAL